MFWEVKTTFLGADAPTTFYFRTEKAARIFADTCDNYDLKQVQIDGVYYIPFNGCVWNDILYHCMNH